MSQTFQARLPDTAFMTTRLQRERKEMNYRLYSRSTHEPIDALPMHVLAYAYRRAWRFLHGSDPQGKHVIDGLSLLIEFSRRNAGE